MGLAISILSSVLGALLVVLVVVVAKRRGWLHRAGGGPGHGLADSAPEQAAMKGVVPTRRSQRVATMMSRDHGGAAVPVSPQASNQDREKRRSTVVLAVVREVVFGLPTRGEGRLPAIEPAGLLLHAGCSIERASESQCRPNGEGGTDSTRRFNGRFIGTVVATTLSTS